MRLRGDGGWERFRHKARPVEAQRSVLRPRQRGVCGDARPGLPAARVDSLQVHSLPRARAGCLGTSRSSAPALLSGWRHVPRPSLTGTFYRERAPRPWEASGRARPVPCWPAFQPPEQWHCSAWICRIPFRCLASRLKAPALSHPSPGTRALSKMSSPFTGHQRSTPPSKQTREQPLSSRFCLCPATRSRDTISRQPMCV